MFPEHSRVGRYGPDHLTFDRGDTLGACLIAPDSWRLPFARRWRDARPASAVKPAD